MDSCGLCLSEELLLSYASGQCDSSEVVEVERHLDECTECQQWLNCWLQAEQPVQPVDSEVAAGSEPTTFTEGFVVNGRYQIRRFVGRGGMGEVYEAEDQLTSSRVALKTLLCSRGNNPRAVRRFRQEVRNALRIGHRHVCRINELQEHCFEDAADSSILFFTMEFVDGKRLAEHLQERRLSTDEVRIVAMQLLEGLEAAHRQQILHLDFKSDNVILRDGVESPFAVVMDFGLSRALDSGGSAHSTSRMQVAGTLPYMSVEQLECRALLQPTADVYSFGVVLYEMLTGQLPFQAPSLSSMLVKQLRDRPKPPSLYHSSLSPEIDRFVMRCLASAAQRRFADAGQARRALEHVTHWSRLERDFRPWWFAVAGVCVVVSSAVWWPTPHGRQQSVSLPLHTVKVSKRATVPLSEGEQRPNLGPSSLGDREQPLNTPPEAAPPSLALPRPSAETAPFAFPKPRSKPGGGTLSEAPAARRRNVPNSGEEPEQRVPPRRPKRRLFQPYELSEGPLDRSSSIETASH